MNARFGAFACLAALACAHEKVAPVAAVENAPAEAKPAQEEASDGAAPAPSSALVASTTPSAPVSPAPVSPAPVSPTASATSPASSARPGKPPATVATTSLGLQPGIGDPRYGIGDRGAAPEEPVRRLPPPVMRDVKLEVAGGLALEVVRRLIHRNYGRMRLCYEKARQSDPTIAGTVTTTFVIDSSGAATSVAIASSTFADKFVAECIERGMRYVKISPPDGRTLQPTQVTHALQFAPGKP